MNTKNYIELGVSLAVIAAGLRASNPVKTLSQEVVSTFPSSLVGFAQPQDATLHDNECVTDADCNPGVANPSRFTSVCVDNLVPSAGNQGGTCK